MSAWPPSNRAARGELLAVLARWLLGGFFVYMGLSKALHPEVFLKLVRQYELVGNPYLLNGIAAALPWFEVFCGLLLLAGVAVRGAALMLLLMLVPFTVVVIRRALAIAAAQGIAFWTVKFDCGCGSGEVLIWKKVLENSLFALLSCWLLAGRGRSLSARFSLFGPGEPKAGTQNPATEQQETASKPPSEKLETQGD